MLFLNRIVTLVLLLLFAVLTFYFSRESCPSDTFICSAHGTCISKNEICNGEEICPNGEDEDPVLCSEEYNDMRFINRYSNMSLEYGYNKINQCDIANFPNVCRCQYSIRLVCPPLGFHNLPQTPVEPATHLVLTNTTLDVLPADVFANQTEVIIIRLENNRLFHLPPGLFSYQAKLEELYLMNNSLTSISQGVFVKLPKLKWLFLDYNYLEYIYLDDFSNLVSLKWLTLSHNKLVLAWETFPLMPSLSELFIDHNEMTGIRQETFENLINLEVLTLRNNKIQTIHENAFSRVQNLRELDLQENNIKSLPSSVFSSLANLNNLYIGFNNFEYLPMEIFRSLFNLTYLNLEEIEIRNIHTQMFTTLKNLESIYFKRYSYCLYVGLTERCRPLSDGISSSDRLLHKPIFRYTTWFTCFATCAGNIMVLFGRYIFRDENKVLSLIIKNLAASDLLMGIYLLLIGIHDLKYRNVYILEAQNWMSSWTCTITGIIAMISCEVSVLLLVFMSVDRFLIIAMPYGRYSALTMRETIIALTFIWCLGVILAVFPALAYLSSTRFYGVNGLCFPLHIDDPYLVGWEYSAVIFFGINATGLIIICVVYVGMFISIWKTRNATNLPSKDYNLAIRFFFIVLTDVTCWLPIVTVKIVAFIGGTVSADVYGWLVIFILPINSALNPILYTFTTPKYRTEIIKKVPSLIKEAAKISKNNGNKICAREIDNLKLNCTKENNLTKTNVKIVVNKF